MGRRSRRGIRSLPAFSHMPKEVRSDPLRVQHYRLQQQTKQLKRQPAFRDNRREGLGEIRQTGAAGFVPRISKR
ncbi:hypothetical protein [Photobacterium ganghwense]|uniref:hypothetical protein n=1 Tax=Photobacterium ganghwense TaxID=320778 RepID=UPI001A8EDE7A|nr:hypothetical protein [Photobacterium ganghwense]QSV17327.1 hypothetical protein FH974_20590 [Photobacterium ganghwense]